MTDFGTDTVTLANGMTQTERRCVFAHELEHVRRGPAHRCEQRKERDVDAAAARWLMPDERSWGTR